MILFLAAKNVKEMKLISFFSFYVVLGEVDSADETYYAGERASSFYDDMTTSVLLNLDQE